MRIRLTKRYDTSSLDTCNNIDAEIIAIGKRGTIDREYVNKRAIQELKDYGYAYVNQPKERIV